MGVNRYPDEFRAEAVRLARTTGRQKKEIAESLGISEQTSYAWLRNQELLGHLSPAAFEERLLTA
jgi:transposase-like protein